MTEMEKSSLEPQLETFPLSSIKHASGALLRKGRNDPITRDDMVLAVGSGGGCGQHGRLGRS